MIPGTDARLAEGFADPVLGAQTTFRAALHAFGHPGSIVEAGNGLQAPSPIQPAAAALALSLFDMETPVWLDSTSATPTVKSFLRFHCGSPLVDSPMDARFAVIADAAAAPDLSAFDAGSDEAPDGSATLIVQVRRFVPGMGLRLSGPGIKGRMHLQIDGLPPALLDQRRAARADFPRGIDILFVAGTRLVGLPRTTTVED